MANPSDKIPSITPSMLAGMVLMLLENEDMNFEELHEQAQLSKFQYVSEDKLQKCLDTLVKCDYAQVDEATETCPTCDKDTLTTKQYS
jgi:hypothetical protein